ncbi:MAG TPA: NAD(P)(+) transhydrogenase (Re/Si-specific) subunit beta, partial [Trueperaceae bacterium]|nr:NAD(P)(+) transhydrogenase (Re/Si-specific) subunit beta [Trueperaceae bacterium]
METLIPLAYIVSAVLFILGLKMLGRAASARKGNMLSAVGMLIAAGATLLQSGIDYTFILIGVLIGAAIGLYIARTVKMTAMPEMVALLNGSGGLASMLVGWNEYIRNPHSDVVSSIAVFAAVVIGAVTTTGSGLAWAKLSERISGKPILFGSQQLVNAGLLAGTVILGVIFVIAPASS